MSLALSFEDPSLVSKDLDGFEDELDIRISGRFLVDAATKLRITGGYRIYTSIGQQLDPNLANDAEKRLAEVQD
jgi:hypothetical protein